MTVSQDLEEAMTRFDLGFPEEALRLLEKHAATAAGVDRTSLLLQMGTIYLAVEDFSRATTILASVEDLTDDAQAQYLLGLGYRFQGKWNEAREALQQANRLLVNDPAVLSSLGVVLYEKGEKDAGKEMIVRALRLDPSRPATLGDMGWVYASEGNLLAALACVEREVELSGGKSAQTVELLRQLMDMKTSFEAKGIPVSPVQQPRAEADWRQVISLAPHPLPVIEQMAEQVRPRSKRELQRIAEHVNRLWNTTPRPELGGLSPDEVARVSPRVSTVDMPPTPLWLKIDGMAAEANTLRRDMVAFLTHLRDVRYKATTALGNLPLKAIRAINPLLVKPQLLENTIGEHVYRVRTVSDVWRLELLQVLCMTGALADFDKGRPILLQEAGTRFLDSSPARQIWVLLDVWWWHTNWLSAYQWEVFEEFPSHLPGLTLAFYRQVKPRLWVPIQAFVEDLIDAGGLDKISTTNRKVLGYGLRRMVVSILEDFGVLEMKRQPKTLGTLTHSTPVSFRLTPLGAQLIQTI